MRRVVTGHDAHGEAVILQVFSLLIIVMILDGCVSNEEKEIRDHNPKDSLAPNTFCPPLRQGVQVAILLYIALSDIVIENKSNHASN